jgi:hypothetical protein
LRHVGNAASGIRRESIDFWVGSPIVKCVISDHVPRIEQSLLSERTGEQNSHAFASLSFATALTGNRDADPLTAK